MMMQASPEVMHEFWRLIGDCCAHHHGDGRNNGYQQACVDDDSHVLAHTYILYIAVRYY